MNLFYKNAYKIIMKRFYDKFNFKRFSSSNIKVKYIDLYSREINGF